MKGVKVNIERHPNNSLLFPQTNKVKSKKNPNKKMAHKHKQKSNASFPPDIIREILLKLPVESLLRCKSVCKEWYSLISDQHFINSHYTLSSTNNINYEHHRVIYNTYGQDNDLNSCPLYDVLFDKSANNALLLENPLQQPRSRDFMIVGSCNGLLCILVEDDNTLFIYNPSTRATNSFPGSEQGDCSNVFYGFGYDETTHDYKVVRIWRCAEAYWGTMIYSLKGGSWKEIGRFPCDSLFNDGKFLNGALHWASDVGSGDIVSLDLGKESYGVVLEPEYDVEGDKTCELGVSGEWLCLVCNYDESSVVDVWVMKVYGVKDSWTKLASIPYPDVWWDQSLNPLCISNDGKVLLVFGVKLLVYDSKDSSSTIIDNCDRCRQACIVVESLVSPFPPFGCSKGKSASMASSTRGEPTSKGNSKEFNTMTSESYWLSRIGESEKAAMHHISLGFFKLALEAGCQNIKQLRDELESYDCRHNLLGLGESAKQVFQSYQILKQQEKRVNSLES